MHRVGFALLVTLSFVSWVHAQPVSYFRYDGGVAPDGRQSLPTHLGREDQLVWRRELQPGHSTPCVTSDSVYLTTFDVDREALATIALDRATGAVRWTRRAPAESIEPFHPVGSPAASTPAWDGQRLVVFFGSYGLLCYDWQGKLLWSKPLGPFRNEYGASSSPILVDDKVILNQDHDVDSFLLAVDRKTGRTVWKSDRPGATRSYSTPVLWRREGETQILVAGALNLSAYNPRDGRRLWWLRGLSRIVDTTPAVAQGFVYLVKNSGVVTSLDSASGRLLKRARISGRGNYYASPVAGDGKVYCASERGVLSVLKAGRQWETVAHHDFGERIMATPVIRDGQIFVRTDQALYCYGTH